MKRLALLAVLLPACAAGPPAPAVLETRHEQCASCRMAVSQPRFAAQVVAPMEEPKFFDDVGCLQRYLEGAPLAKGAVAYVADHRTGAWVRAEQAVFTRVALETPMGSHVIAHADAASRDLDPAASNGTPWTMARTVSAAPGVRR
jgi:copper chaperone NosL